jgi:hypothetical protein
METDQDGKLWLKKKLTIKTFSTNTVEIGAFEEIDNDYKAFKKVMDANSTFKIFEDGHVKAKSFEGTGSFNGQIFATGGQIGGLTIDEWAEMGFSLKVESDAGWVLKNNTKTTLRATLYKGNVKCGSTITVED